MHSGDTDDSILAVLEDEALTSLAQSSGGVPSLPASNDGLEAEFFAATHKFFRMWLAEKGGPKAGVKPCAIVLSRSISQDIETLGAKRLFYFESTADAIIGGKVLIANNDLSIVAEVPFGKCLSENAVANALDRLGLANAVHCLMRGHRGEMVLCRDGLNGPTTLLKVEQASVLKLGPTEIDKQLWAFHRKFTQTSSGVLRPWKGKSENRVTIDEAELRISLMLGFYLGTVVGEDNITVEDQLPHGRLDIKISGHVMKSTLGPCAMECKVLRSKESAGTIIRNVPLGKMVDHASGGIQQAVEYRQDIGGKLAYLCCFDARLVDEDQPEVQALAKANDVTLRRYFMYTSPGEHRKAAAAAKKAGALLTCEVA
ncbi:hypothetical protein LB535_10230 [Mesorhizobium sp. CA10]|uniref:hypothetical protein n=1 Tax=Mesorhizobium sp. CA10 TaxID=588495 RepID=UPI001CCA0E8D|nr:hypothetical protein [Mesorhizobium sp. CA10]MBZ9882730.1 hypothetical protein [Mesorhizobium sp. CA10]